MSRDGLLSLPLTPLANGENRLVGQFRVAASCRVCGSMQQLQVHHLEFRSQSGGDVEQNLITLVRGMPRASPSGKRSCCSLDL
ncbi:MAG: HNH endonuclease [Candidatus Acidiferrales bacterium]